MTINLIDIIFVILCFTSSCSGIIIGEAATQLKKFSLYCKCNVHVSLVAKTCAYPQAFILASINISIKFATSVKHQILKSACLISQEKMQLLRAVAVELEEQFVCCLQSKGQLFMLLM